MPAPLILFVQTSTPEVLADLQAEFGEAVAFHHLDADPINACIRQADHQGKQVLIIAGPLMPLSGYDHFAAFRFPGYQVVKFSLNGQSDSLHDDYIAVTLATIKNHVALLASGRATEFSISRFKVANLGLSFSQRYKVELLQFIHFYQRHHDADYQIHLDQLLFDTGYCLDLYNSVGKLLPVERLYKSYNVSMLAYLLENSPCYAETLGKLRFSYDADTDLVHLAQAKEAVPYDQLEAFIRDPRQSDLTAILHKRLPSMSQPVTVYELNQVFLHRKDLFHFVTEAAPASSDKKLMQKEKVDLIAQLEVCLTTLRWSYAWFFLWQSPCDKILCLEGLIATLTLPDYENWSAAQIVERDKTAIEATLGAHRNFFGCCFEDGQEQPSSLLFFREKTRTLQQFSDVTSLGLHTISIGSPPSSDDGFLLQPGRR